MTVFSIFVLLFSRLMLVNCQCLSFDTENICNFCAWDYYDTKLIDHIKSSSPLKKTDCEKKSIGYCQRNILILNNSSNEISNVTFFNEVYYDMVSSFLDETMNVANCSEGELIFYISKGSHSILNTSLSLDNVHLFRRIKINIIMKPLYCSEFAFSDIICLNYNEYPTIFFEKLIVSFVISGSFEIEGLIFKMNDIFEFNREQNNFFQLEAIYDDINIIIPSLNLTNVIFINFSIPKGKSLISIDYFGGNLTIKNLTLSSCLFWNILIFDDSLSLEKEIYAFLEFKKYLDDFNKKKLLLKSGIEINGLSLENCNQSTFDLDNNTDVFALILMNNYRGNIVFNSFLIRNFQSYHIFYLFYFTACQNVNIITQISLQNIENFNLFYIEKSNTLIQNVTVKNSSWNNNAIYLFNNTNIMLDSLVMIQSSSRKQDTSFTFLYASFSQIFINKHYFEYLTYLYFQFFNTVLTINNSTYREINKFEMKFLYSSFLSLNNIWNKIWGFNSFLQFQACFESYIFNNEIVNFDGSFFIGGFSVSNLTIAYSNFFNLSNMSYVLNKATTFQTLTMLHSSFTNLFLNLGFAYSSTYLVLLIDSSRYTNVSIFGKKTLNFIRIQAGHEIVQSSSFFNIKIFAGGNGIFAFISANVVVKNTITVDCGFAYPIYPEALTSIEYSELFYLWRCYEILFQNNTLLVSGNINLFSGLLYCTLVQINLTVEGNIFKYMNKVPNNYYTGVILSNAPNLILMNNKFDNIQCPNFPSFIHNNGAVSLQGDASYKSLYNKKTCILINNLFFGCQCQSGGSLGIINYDIIKAKNLYFYNSSASVGGVVFISASSFALFDSIIVNHTYAYHSHTMYLMNILEINLNNVTITNALSVRSSGFRINNVLKLNFIDFNVINATSLDFGGVFYLQLGNTFISNGIFFLCQALNGGILFINRKGNITLDNIKALKTSSKFGGAFYIDSINSVEINQSIFDNISSIFQGSALFINMVSILKIHDSIFSFCETLNSGIIFLKNSETDSEYFLKNISCSYNKAFSGSCIFAEAKGTLKIFQFISEGNINNSLYLSTEMEFNVSLEEAKFFNCSTNYIVYTLNIEIYMGEIIFEKNKANNAIIYADSFSRLKINRVSFRENYNKYISTSIPLIYSIDSVINCSQINFTQPHNKENSFYLMEIIRSNILLSLSNFSNLTHSSDYFIHIDKSIFKSETVFFNQVKGVIITSSDSNITINNSIFLNNIMNDFYLISELSGSSYLDNTFLYMTNSNFSVSSNISISLINFDLIYINNCHFDGNAISYGIKLRETLVVNITDCLFTNFSNRDDGGGALSILSEETHLTNVLISNTSFLNNMACYSGAFIIEGLFKIQIFNSSFIKNRALLFGSYKCGIAAVAMFICKIYKECLATVKNNLFQENFADFLSPTIHSFSKTIVDNNIFLDNFDKNNFTTQISSFPLHSQVSNESLTISSGSSFQLIINLKDSFNQIFYFKSSITASVRKTSEALLSTIFENSDSLPTTKGNFNFSNLIITVTPNTTINLIFQVSIYNDYLLKYQKFSNEFSFYSRPCQIGELWTSDQKCQLCRVGTYSLSNPMNKFNSPKICKKCPTNAFCPGGQLLIPLPGFWRFNSLTAIISPCNIAEACLGLTDFLSNNLTQYLTSVAVPIDLIQGSCLVGHTGILCNNCQKGYGKSEGMCRKCSDNSYKMYLKMFSLLILMCIYILLNTHTFSKTSDTSSMNILTVLSKIFISHIQRLSIISSFDEKIVLNQVTDGLDLFINILSFTNHDNLANDCIWEQFVQNYEDYYLFKCILSVLLPIFISALSIFVLGFYEIFLFFKKKQHYINFKRIYLIFLISVFIFYLLITKTSLSLLNCIYLSESNDSYLFASPNLLCWSGNHQLAFFIAGSLGILFWGILFPIIILYFLKKNYKNCAKPNKIINIARVLDKTVITQQENAISNNFDPYFFFYKDYIRKCYYWEIILFLYKFFLSALPNLSSFVNVELIDEIFLIGTFLYCWALLKAQPFKKVLLNNLESSSNYIIVLSRLFAILSKNFGRHPVLETMFSVLFLIINFFLFGVFAYLFAKNINCKEFFKRYKSKIIKSHKYQTKNESKGKYESKVKIYNKKRNEE